jgi:hypothetical protein
MAQGNFYERSSGLTGSNLSVLEELLNSYRTFRRDEQGLLERATILQSLNQEGCRS